MQPRQISFFEDVLTTTAVTTSLFFFTTGPLSGWCLFLYLLFCTRFWWLMVIYLIYFISTFDAYKYGRTPSSFVRNFFWWRYNANYYPLTIHTKAKLDLNKSYLIASYPHGFLSTSTFTSLIMEYSGIKDYFPHHTTRVAVMNMQFFSPFYRDIMLWLGASGCDAQTILYLLKQPRTILGLMPGGAEEALLFRRNEYKLVVRKRKGFVKMALKSGADLVPALGFGDVNMFEQSTNKYVVSFLKTFKKWFGWAPIVPKGRFGIGLTPHRVPLNYVIGEPIAVTKNENPTIDEINELQEKFIKGLFDIFEENKSKFIENGENVKLEIVA